MKFELGRTRRLMAALGNPQDAFPAIHIAGTNGKGSVAAFLASILRSAGYRTGLYTSPHLARVNERFQIDGRMISDRELARLVRRVRAAAGTLRPTEFEFLTAVAFAWFRERRVEAAVIETGLGGRLDATNVIRRPLLTVITNVGRDHTDWLGSSIPSIAREKAGIIKPGVPVVTGATGAALSVVRQTARRRGAPLVRIGSREERLLRRRLPRLPLRGAHQRRNAAIAFSAAELLAKRGGSVEKLAIIRGLRTASWPGRLERFIVRGPFGRRTVWLDGAHNPPGAAALAAFLRASGLRGLSVLFGVLKDKDAAAMIDSLVPFVWDAVVVPLDTPRSADPVAIAGLPAWRGRARPARTLRAGWRRVLRTRSRVVLVTGSLYLVGAVRRTLIGRKAKPS